MTDQLPISVLIADDHYMVRRGLSVLLSEFPDFTVVGEVVDGELAVAFCRQHCPDVVLMDMLMPRIDGVQATQMIRQVCPATQVIALTSFMNEEMIQDMLKAGAAGFLMKNVSGDELALAIRRAREGQPTLAPEVAQVLIRASVQPPAIGHDLTEREREVLKLMIQGLNNREIGENLIISSSTVKNHVSSILSKLGTVTRTQAVALAVEHKIVE